MDKQIERINERRITVTMTRDEVAQCLINAAAGATGVALTVDVGARVTVAADGSAVVSMVEDRSRAPAP